MNKQVSIMDYEQKLYGHPNIKPDMSLVGNVTEKHDVIREIWNSVAWFKPESKNLFGKEHKLGLKYHINKLHLYFEEQVKLFELDYYNSMYKRFPKNILPASLELKLKKVKKKKFITFYDDLKLLQAIDDHDSDWCNWRMMDDEKPEAHLITGFNQSIHYELENRISELKVWKTLTEDTTQ